MSESAKHTNSGRTACILGATGLVGAALLDMLLDSPRYSRVIALTRRNLTRRHPKLMVEVIDFDYLPPHADVIRGDDFFCCIGTTRKKAGSKEAFRKVDLTYVVETAKIAAKNGIPNFLVISSMGANPKSSIFYNQVKGEMEAAVKEMSFKSVTILRPSLLLGLRKEKRGGEEMAQKVFKRAPFLFSGPFRKYRGITVKDVAKAMGRVALRNPEGVRIIESQELQGIADGEPLD